MKRAHSMKLVVAMLAAMIPGLVVAQGDDSTPIYIAVDCMKSSSPDYTQLELETWKPVHQHLVNDGKRASWALYGVVHGERSRCDYYTVTTFYGDVQLNDHAGYQEAFAAVHPDMDMGELMAKTGAARELVSTELWVQLDQTEIQPHRFAFVNRMYADDPAAYETMESKVFKAGHQVLIDKGERAGWALYALISPIGSSIPYNYGTVDFSNHLGPVPMAEAMLAGNPDRDLEALSDLLEIRDHILTETWALIGSTDPATD